MLFPADSEISIRRRRLGHDASTLVNSGNRNEGVNLKNWYPAELYRFCQMIFLWFEGIGYELQCINEHLLTCFTLNGNGSVGFISEK